MADKFTLDGDWVIDDRNNRASITRWGSRKNAKNALLSCKWCTDCSDCFHCSGCSGCSDCSECSDCSGCSGCSECSECSDCSGCSGCSNCLECSDCSDCSHCSGCDGCPNLVKNGIISIFIPRIENIHQKVYKAASAPKALDMAKFHSCNTTHCRAGWVIHLAGEAGYELEKITGPVFAAMQIYKASGYTISPCRFFDSDEAALKDMERLSGQEKHDQKTNRK